MDKEETISNVKPIIKEALERIYFDIGVILKELDNEDK